MNNSEKINGIMNKRDPIIPLPPPKFSSVLSDGLIVDCCIDDIIASMSERNKAMVNVVFS